MAWLTKSYPVCCTTAASGSRSLLPGTTTTTSSSSTCSNPPPTNLLLHGHHRMTAATRGVAAGISVRLPCSPSVGILIRRYPDGEAMIASAAASDRMHSLSAPRLWRSSSSSACPSCSLSSSPLAETDNYCPLASRRATVTLRGRRGRRAGGGGGGGQRRGVDSVIAAAAAAAAKTGGGAAGDSSESAPTDWEGEDGDLVAQEDTRAIAKPALRKGDIVRVDKELYLKSVEFKAVDHPPNFTGLDYIYEDRGEVLDIREFEAGQYCLLAWAGIPTAPAWLPTYMLIKAERLSYVRD